MSDYTAQHIHKQVRGWLLPYLLDLDIVPGIGSGRWDYWLKICDTLNLPDDPIPQVQFIHGTNDMPWHSPYPDDLKEHPFKHIQRVLEPYLWNGGGWYDDAWLAFVKWLLHGFGRTGLEKEIGYISEKVRDHWYTEFNLAYLLTVPIDWSAFILQSGPRWMGKGQAKWAKGTAFYSTPMNVCNMMASMSFLTHDDQTDTRVLTVCDPCVGTGSMLLAASNYSLRLYGQDIVYDLCLCAELNGYLFMPWLVCMPSQVEEMFNAITGEIDYHGMPITLETDPETVEITQVYRQEQYDLQQSFMDDLNIKVVDVSKPAKVIATKSPVPSNARQTELF